MAIYSNYGEGNYSYDLYSEHMQSFVALNSPAPTGTIRRVQALSATAVITIFGAVLGRVQRVRLAAGVAALPVVGWAGTAQRVRLNAGSISGFSLSFAALLSSEYEIRSAFTVSAGSVTMTGDLEVEKFWAQIADPGSEWSDLGVIDPGWTPIEAPVSWE